MKFVPMFLLGFFTIAATSAAGQTANSGVVGEDYSGMYSFVKDGEFIQVTVEEKGVVSGFISRYGDTAADKGAFLDQFIKSGKGDGNKVSFTTENVHQVSFTFEGTFERGPGKAPQDEGYFVMRGTLTRFSTDAEKKTTSQARQVEFKSFPRDAEPAPH
jgi:hypothetical protein